MDNVTIERLKTLNTLISLPVAENVQAALIIWAIQSIYAKLKDGFRFHPSNTLLFRSVSALEQRSTVDMVDIIKNYKIEKMPPEIEKSIKRLLLHRDRLSHPFLQHWHTTEKQKFIESKEDWTDIRTAYILNMKTIIHSELDASGNAPQEQNYEVTEEMAVLIHTIITLSAPKELSDIFLPGEDVHSSLEGFMKEFISFCSKKILKSSGA